MARRIKHPVARKREIASTLSPGSGVTPGTRTSPRKRVVSPLASATNTTGIKKARHFRPGTVSLREIGRL